MEKNDGDVVKVVNVKKETEKKPTLLSSEKLDRASPEMWPEKVPGVATFSRKTTSTHKKDPASTELTQDDIRLIYQLANLPASGLIGEIKKIFDEGYDLGKNETKEMTRGKYLNIFSNSNRKYK